MPYSEQTRIRPEAANYAAGRPMRGAALRITLYHAAGVSVCGLVYFSQLLSNVISLQFVHIGHNTSSLEFIALEIHSGFIFVCLDYSLFALKRLQSKKD